MTPRRFYHSVKAKLRPLDRALVRYYAERYRCDQSTIIRSMILRVAQADRTFDIKKFQQCVKDLVFPESERDERLQEDFKRHVDLFFAERKRFAEGKP